MKLKRFSTYDLVLLSVLCALTVAFKAVARLLIGLITTPLGIPGGSLAGGLYMLWLPLAIAVVGKRGSALLMTLIQCIVVLVTAMPGSHGIWTFATYLLPAAAAEIVMLFSRRTFNVLHFMLACLLANVVGTMASNLLFFRLTSIALYFTLSAAAFSGALGGALGYLVFKRAVRSGILGKLNGKVKGADAQGNESFIEPTDASPLEKAANDERQIINDDGENL